MILLDDEDDPFIIFITDTDLRGFDLFSANSYLSFNVNLFYHVANLVDEFCENYDEDGD